MHTEGKLVPFRNGWRARGYVPKEGIVRGLRENGVPVEQTEQVSKQIDRTSECLIDFFQEGIALTNHGTPLSPTLQKLSDMNIFDLKQIKGVTGRIRETLPPLLEYDTEYLAPQDKLDDTKQFAKIGSRQITLIAPGFHEKLSYRISNDNVYINTSQQVDGTLFYRLFGDASSPLVRFTYNLDPNQNLVVPRTIFFAALYPHINLK
jgi:hypothetical protein